RPTVLPGRKSDPFALLDRGSLTAEEPREHHEANDYHDDDLRDRSPQSTDERPDTRLDGLLGLPSHHQLGHNRTGQCSDEEPERREHEQPDERADDASPQPGTTGSVE